MQRKIPKQDDPKQSKRFVDTAKQIDANEDQEAADKAFKRVVAVKPSKVAR